MAGASNDLFVCRHDGTQLALSSTTGMEMVANVSVAIDEQRQRAKAQIDLLGECCASVIRQGISTFHCYGTSKRQTFEVDLSENDIVSLVSHTTLRDSAAVTESLLQSWASSEDVESTAEDLLDAMQHDARTSIVAFVGTNLAQEHQPPATNYNSSSSKEVCINC
jgi:hypothetical protein